MHLLVLHTVYTVHCTLYSATYAATRLRLVMLFTADKELLAEWRNSLRQNSQKHQFDDKKRGGGWAALPRASR